MTERKERGRLIVFEGYDGVGKSTLVEQLTCRLRRMGLPCEHMAFPERQTGSLGQAIYDLHHKIIENDKVNPTSLQLLHIAAHIDAIEGRILPTLSTGTWIVLDRFWWSTLAYGAASGVPGHSLREMIRLEKFHWGPVSPDVLFLVEREIDTPDDDEKSKNQILREYRDLANREQCSTRVVTLYNNSTIEDAIDTVWKVIAPIAW